NRHVGSPLRSCAEPCPVDDWAIVGRSTELRADAPEATQPGRTAAAYLRSAVGAVRQVPARERLQTRRLAVGVAHAPHGAAARGQLARASGSRSRTALPRQTRVAAGARVGTRSAIADVGLQVGAALPASREPGFARDPRVGAGVGAGVVGAGVAG